MDECDALKVLLAGVETWLREERAALVEAINEHTAATKAQTALLEALCDEAKAMGETVDALCSHTGRLGNVEGTLRQSPSLFNELQTGRTLFRHSSRV